MLFLRFYWHITFLLRLYLHVSVFTEIIGNPHSNEYPLKILIAFRIETIFDQPFPKQKLGGRIVTYSYDIHRQACFLILFKYVCVWVNKSRCNFYNTPFPKIQHNERSLFDYAHGRTRAGYKCVSQHSWSIQSEKWTIDIIAMIELGSVFLWAKILLRSKTK